MIEDLMKLKQQIDTMIETYKDLHPDEPIEIGSTIEHGSTTIEDYQKYNALKKVREGTYESTFREKQRQKTTESSQGSPTLCVYGDS